jgi:hypothetical protein
VPEEGLDQPGESVGSPATSAGGSARAIRRADGLTALQALQRVLYRCAKQDPARRCHALHDKLTRSDVMWQAWCDVAANRGAPGVDGITIESIVSEGVEGCSCFPWWTRRPDTVGLLSTGSAASSIYSQAWASW